MKRRIYIGTRLAGAAVMWSLMALMIGMGKADAGLPAATPEWNETWEDYRRWALNPPPRVLTPLAKRNLKLNIKYTVPVLLLMHSAIPVRLLTDRALVIALCGVVALALSVGLVVVQYCNEKKIGTPLDAGDLWGSFIFLFLLLPPYYVVLAFVTAALIGR